MLVSELIDRTYAEWLYPGSDEQPQFDTLSGAIADDDMTIVLAGRAEHVPRDTVLQIESELILVQSASGSTVTVAQRGFGGTAAAAHADATITWIDPTFTRIEIFNALRSLIGKLYPWGVYDRYVDTAATFTTRSVITAPTGTKEIHSITVRRPTDDELYDVFTIRGTDWVEYKAFTPIKYRIRRRSSEGQAMNVVCIRDFTLPTSEADDLTATTRVPEALQEDLPMAVAGMVLKGRQVPQVLIDRIRELLAQNGQNPGMVSSVGDALLNAFRRDAVIAERRRLAETDEPAFEWQRR